MTTDESVEPRPESRRSIPIRGGPVRCGLEIDGSALARYLAVVVAAEALAVGRELDRSRAPTAAQRRSRYRSGLPNRASRALELRSYARGDLGRRLQRKGHPRPAVEVALERVARTACSTMLPMLELRADPGCAWAGTVTA